MADDRQLAGRFTRADGERLLRYGTVVELLELRAAITDSLHHIEGQLDEHQTLGTGGSEEWALRARGARRAYMTWLSRISSRLAQLRDVEQPRGAVVIRGAGKSSDKVAEAINALVARGCRVISFCVVGTDLVVLATEPRPEARSPQRSI